MYSVQHYGSGGGIFRKGWVLLEREADRMGKASCAEKLLILCNDWYPNLTLYKILGQNTLHNLSLVSCS